MLGTCLIRHRCDEGPLMAGKPELKEANGCEVEVPCRQGQNAQNLGETRVD